MKISLFLYLFFKRKVTIGYLKIIFQLIIVLDFQINQCKFSIILLALSLLKKLHSQLSTPNFVRGIKKLFPKYPKK